jgi:hypothetical protein
MSGGNKGGGGTTYQTSQVQIPPEVLARYNAVNARAETAASVPWQAYGGEFVAPVNQTQQGGIDAISGAAGVDKPYFDQATGVINQAIPQTQQLYGTAAGQIGAGYDVGKQYTQQGIDTATGAAGAASPYNGLATGQLNNAYGDSQLGNYAALGLAAAGTGQVNAADLDINRYMSPYNEAVVQSTLGNLRQEQGSERADQRDSQILGGSFGGDRSGVASANMARQQNMAYGQVAGNLYNANYGQALSTAAQQQDTRLRAEQANRAALSTGAQNIAGISQQMFNQGDAAAKGNLGIGQQIYNQGQGLAGTQMAGGQQLYNQATGTASANAGLASGMASTAAGTAGALGQLGTQQQQNQIAQGTAQVAAGTVEQQTRQAQDTAEYEQFLQEKGYPFQTAQFLANIAMGTGAQSGSTTNTVNSTAQPYFSDERLKENMVPIGTTNDGQPIYRYNYKGDPSTQIGLSAQETEKHHPDAVGLASGYKTVDYDAATQDSIEKAGGGGLTAGNDHLTQLLARQRAMFPGGAHDPRGIATGVGPHGVPIAPLKAQAPQAAKVDMQRPQQQTGAKQDIDSAMGLYKTGKGLAEAYSEGKDALFGTAGKDGKDGTGGFLGKDGKWNPEAGWAGRQYDAGKTWLDKQTGTAPPTFTREELPPPAASSANDGGIRAATVADAGFGDDAGLATGASNMVAEVAPEVVAEVAPEMVAEIAPELLEGLSSFAFARDGGRVGLSHGGGAMPYKAPGYIPKELYEPVAPEKPDEAAKSKMDSGGGGQKKKDDTGKAVGSLVGAGIGSFFGPVGMGLGSMAGGMLGGMAARGGRVGLATGGSQLIEDEETRQERIAQETDNDLLPRPRGGPVATLSQPIGLATPPPAADRPPAEMPRGLGHEPLAPPNLPPPAPGTPLPYVAFDSSPESWNTARSLQAGDKFRSGAHGGAERIVRAPLYTAQDQNPVPESGTALPAQGLATGQNSPPSAVVPTLPDGTPVMEDSSQRAFSPAQPPPPPPAAAPPPAGTPPVVQQAKDIVASGRAAAAPGGDLDHSPAGVFPRMLTQESGTRQFDDKGQPITSAKGATGIAQVMPGTGPEAAKLAGVPWRPDVFSRGRTGDPALDKETEDYNRQLGQAYYTAQVQKYGDPYVAAAAYNAGPGAVDAAMQKARERGGSYLDYLPTETQNYVSIVSGKTARPQAVALRDNTGTGGQGGLGSGQPPAATNTPAETKETPDFLDRAGNWIDRNQRPIMAGLAFIGNMLGSKSHQLTGAIGDGLAAAAPMYMATGFRQEELKQGQERIDIGARAQYMSVLAQQQKMQSDYMYANKSQRSPELDAQMAQTIALINGKGGTAAVPGGAPDSLRAPATAPGATPVKTDLAPSAPITSTPLATPAAPGAPPAAGATPTAPTPSTSTGGPPPMTDTFLRQLDPNRNPVELRRRSEQQYANGDEAGGARLENQARAEEQSIIATGQGIGPGNTQVRLPGWDTYQATQKNIAVNQDWLQKAEKATEARLAARQNVNQIKALIETFESGTGTDIKAQIAGVADAIGLPRPQTDTMDQAAFKSFLKDAYNQILSMGAAGRDTDNMRAQVEGAFANPTLPPEANKKILAQFLGNLNYEDAYAEHLAKSIKGNQLVDQKLVGDQWRGADKEKNNPEYYRKEAYKDIAALGATPENTRDIQDGHHYMLKPEEFFKLQGPNGKYTVDQIRQWYKEQGKRAVKFKATRNETGGIDWKMVK